MGRARLPLKGPEDVANLRVELESFENSEELSLFIAEMVLHDGRHAIQMTTQLRRRRATVDRVAEIPEKVTDHRMVPFECA